MNFKQKTNTAVVKSGDLIFPPILEQIAIGIACVSLEGQWLYANNRVSEITGYSTEELQKITFQEITHPDDLESDLLNLQSLLTGEIPDYSLEKRYIRKDQTYVWIDIIVSLVRNIHQTSEYFVASIEDITERKQMEEEREAFLVREEEARQRAHHLNEQLSILQVITDTVLAHLSLDPLFQAILSQIRKIMAADNIAILLVDDSGRFLTIRAVLGVEEIIAQDVRIPVGRGFAGKIAAQRQPIIVDDTSTVEILNPVLRNELRSLLGVPLIVEERVIGVMHIGMKHYYTFTEQDVQLFQRVAERLAMAIERSLLHEAVQKARQEAIEHAQYVDRLYEQQNNFVSMVSHEFRTMLTGIQGFSDILRSGFFPPGKVQEYATDIYEDSLRLLRMINDLLDAKRIQAGKVELRLATISLPKLLQEQVTRIQSINRSHTLRLEIDTQLPLIEGDEDKINQIISNLLSNATKYSPAGGEILIHCFAERPYVHLSIQDEGIGIPPEALDKIFASYNRVFSEQTRYIQGTGLGLAIVKGIVELHKGRVWATSTPGKGSTFHVLFPILQTRPI